MDTALAAATPLPDNGDHGNLKLSGVDTFSPAPSQPGSPTLQRHEFAQLQHAHWDMVTSSVPVHVNDSASSLYVCDRGTRGSVGDGAAQEAGEGHYGSEKLRRAGGGGDGDVGDGDRNSGLGVALRAPGEHGARSPSEYASESAGSSSGDESYTILDRDSGSGMDDAGLVLRRRTRQGVTRAVAE